MRYGRRPNSLPAAPEAAAPWDAPGLPAALERLAERHRVAVLLCEGFGWTRAEAAEFFGVSPSTMQRHVERGMARLRRALGVSDDA